MSLIVAYHDKFNHQNKNPTVYRLLVCSFSLASITVYFLKGSKYFFYCFLLAAAKSALSILTVKYRVPLIS